MVTEEGSIFSPRIESSSVDTGTTNLCVHGQEPKPPQDGEQSLQQSQGPSNRHGSGKALHHRTSGEVSTASSGGPGHETPERCVVARPTLSNSTRLSRKAQRSSSRSAAKPHRHGPSEPSRCRGPLGSAELDTATQAGGLERNGCIATPARPALQLTRRGNVIQAASRVRSDDRGSRQDPHPDLRKDREPQLVRSQPQPTA